jgi:hypothetical protein
VCGGGARATQHPGKEREKERETAFRQIGRTLAGVDGWNQRAAAAAAAAEATDGNGGDGKEDQSEDLKMASFARS